MDYFKLPHTKDDDKKNIKSSETTCLYVYKSNNVMSVG